MIRFFITLISILLIFACSSSKNISTTTSSISNEAVSNSEVAEPTHQKIDKSQPKGVKENQQNGLSREMPMPEAANQDMIAPIPEAGAVFPESATENPELKKEEEGKKKKKKG